MICFRRTMFTAGPLFDCAWVSAIARVFNSRGTLARLLAFENHESSGGKEVQLYRSSSYTRIA